MRDDNIEFVRSLYSAFGRGDIKVIVDAMADDVDWQAVGRAEDYPLFRSRRGPKAVQKFFEAIQQYQEFLEFDPREFFGAGRRVVVLGETLVKVRKSGQAVRTPWCHVYSVDSGKVTSFRDFLDIAQFAEAFRG